MQRTAYKQGYNDFSPNVDPQEACPYSEDDHRYDDWNRGWDDAFNDHCDYREQLGGYFT